MCLFCVCVAQAVCQLSRPTPRWLGAWQDASASQLKGLGDRELCTAAEVLLLHGVTPTKPWMGLWCVAMEVRGSVVAHVEWGCGSCG